MIIKPLNDQILISVPKVNEKTSSGIIKDKSTIASEKKDMEKPYSVVAVSSKIEGIKAGDKVFLKGGPNGAVLWELPVEHPEKEFIYCLVPLHSTLCIIDESI